MKFSTQKHRKKLENLRLSTFSTSFYGGKRVEEGFDLPQMWKTVNRQ